MTKLWVKFQAYNATGVSTIDCKNVDAFLEACKTKLSHKLGPYDSDELCLSTTQGGPSLRPDTLLTDIPSQPGYDENSYEHPLFISVIGESTLGGKRRRLSYDLNDVIKARRGSVSGPLLETSGSDFIYSDRERSFKVLLDCEMQRFNAWKQGKSDKNLHPLPFVADGPGSGKSRFLQELSGDSFKDFVEKSDASDDFKDMFSNALFININFGNGTAYVKTDSDIGIEKAICLRIQYQIFAPKENNFDAFVGKMKGLQVSLSSILDNFSSKVNCLVLGIDEINKVYEHSDTEFRAVFDIVGKLSCSSPIFFVPVLAGTVIGPAKNVVRKSMHPPCHIPLPLLSLDSCEKILKAKIPDLDTEDARFKQVLSDIGGHCRALEFLYDEMVSHNIAMQDYWNTVCLGVRMKINKRYRVSNIALGRAIAYTFLSIPVAEDNIVVQGISFLDLEEAGLIKLEPKDELFIVKIPFVFVWCHLVQSTDKYARFWYNVLIGKEMGWKEWEEFNQNYIAFRLSLFSFLGKTSVSLEDFFNGAVVNIPNENIMIKIPPIEAIKTSLVSSRYPSTEAPSFEVGECVLNASGAAFDAFVWLNTERPLSNFILAMQMKFSQSDASTLSIDNHLINEEYSKVNDSIAQYLHGSDFLLLMLCQRDGNFDPNLLPSKVAVVSNSELLAFYGDSYYQRLKKE